jgi:hypothetical protein
MLTVSTVLKRIYIKGRIDLIEVLLHVTSHGQWPRKNNT